MNIARASFVALLGMLWVSVAPLQSLAASHQAAAPEKKAEKKAEKAEKADKAEKPAAATARRHVGTVKAVDPSAGTLTITEKTGEAEVSVSDKTTIKKGKDNVKLSDLKPGDEITVVYVKQDGKDMARSVMLKAK